MRPSCVRQASSNAWASPRMTASNTMWRTWSTLSCADFAPPSHLNIVSSLPAIRLRQDPIQLTPEQPGRVRCKQIAVNADGGGLRSGNRRCGRVPHHVVLIDIDGKPEVFDAGES